MKLKAILVEDEETSRQILKNYLQKYCPNVDILSLNFNSKQQSRLGVFRRRNALR